MGHDCESNQYTAPNVYQANLKMIAKAARAGLKKGGTLIWTTTTPPPFPAASDTASVACVNQRNALAKEALAEYNVVVNDLHNEMNDVCGTNFTSCALQLPNHNVHPTPQGRQFLAVKTASVIAPFLNPERAMPLPQFARDDIVHMLPIAHLDTFLV